MPPAKPPQDQSPFVREPDIRDAASLVIVKQDSDGPVSVLMGRRHPDTAFLPNKYVFPGGRFENDDQTVVPAGSLPSLDQKNLMVSVPEGIEPATLQALALTAIRETFEETGVVVGSPHNQGTTAVSPSWQRFYETGHEPDPTNLRFFARAITPPGRARRYDTRFFLVPLTNVSTRVERMDGELDDIGWVTLADAGQRDIASITHHILADLTRLTTPGNGAAKPTGVPFYFHQKDTFHRVLLSHQDGTA